MRATRTTDQRTQTTRLSSAAPFVATTVFVAIVASQLVMLTIWARSGFAAPAYIFLRGPAGLLALEVFLFAQAISGVILVVRRPDNVVGWLIMAFAVFCAYAGFTTGYSAGGPATSEPVREWLAWAGSWLIFPGTALLAVATAFYFPTGRLQGSRWRIPLAGTAVAALVAGVSLAVAPGPLPLFPTIANPMAASGEPGPVGVLIVVGFVGLGLGSLFAGASLVARYRVADRVGRLQLRWYVAAVLLTVIGFLAYLGAILFLEDGSALGELLVTVFFLVLAIPPVAIVIAILRYRLYDIDSILSRAFVYGGLTAILAGLYAASIRLFNGLFTAVTGETSDLALVLTTLLLATTFTPLKGRLERFVDARLRPQPADEAVPNLPLDEPALIALVDRRVQVALDRRWSDQPAEAGRSAGSKSSIDADLLTDESALSATTLGRQAGELDLG
jgi:hypothetical protein